MKKFEDCLDLFIRYKSNATVKDSCAIWSGKVRDVVGKDGEVEINGVLHKVDTIEVLEILTFS